MRKFCSAARQMVYGGQGLWSVEPAPACHLAADAAQSWQPPRGPASTPGGGLEVEGGILPFHVQPEAQTDGLASGLGLQPYLGTQISAYLHGKVKQRVRYPSKGRGEDSFCLLGATPSNSQR